MESVGSVIEWASGLATCAALIVALVTYRNQLNAQVFIEYTNRYATVIDGFPALPMSVRDAFRDDPPLESRELTDAMHRYFNLCSEEFYMHKNKMMSDKVWGIWASEIRRKLASPLGRREWKKLKDEYDTQNEFLEFVEAINRRDQLRTSSVSK